MEYNSAVLALTALRQTHPRYADVNIVSAAECQWVTQKKSIIHKPILLNDKGTAIHEATMSSDIAEGWIPSCKVGTVVGKVMFNEKWLRGNLIVTTT